MHFSWLVAFSSSQVRNGNVEANSAAVLSGSENDLFHAIFDTYNNNVRPQVDGISLTNISVTPTLFNLLSLVCLFHV